MCFSLKENKNMVLNILKHEKCMAPTWYVLKDREMTVQPIMRSSNLSGVPHCYYRTPFLKPKTATKKLERSLWGTVDRNTYAS